MADTFSTCPGCGSRNGKHFDGCEEASSLRWFQRRPDGFWEAWPVDHNPRPPNPGESLPACRHDHGPCFDWRGVHFYALRFPDGTEHRAV